MRLWHQAAAMLLAGTMMGAAVKSFADEGAPAPAAPDQGAGDTWIMRAGELDPVVVLKPGVNLSCVDAAQSLTVTAAPGQPIEVSCAGPVHFRPEHFGSDFKPHGQ